MPPGTSWSTGNPTGSGLDSATGVSLLTPWRGMDGRSLVNSDYSSQVIIIIVGNNCYHHQESQHYNSVLSYYIIL